MRRGILLRDRVTERQYRVPPERHIGDARPVLTDRCDGARRRARLPVLRASLLVVSKSSRQAYEGGRIMGAELVGPVCVIELRRLLCAVYLFLFS